MLEYKRRMEYNETLDDLSKTIKEIDENKEEVKIEYEIHWVGGSEAENG